MSTNIIMNLQLYVTINFNAHRDAISDAIRHHTTCISADYHRDGYIDICAFEHK